MQYMVKQYVETTGAGGCRTVDQPVNSVVTQQVTEQKIDWFRWFSNANAVWWSGCIGGFRTQHSGGIAEKYFAYFL